MGALLVLSLNGNYFCADGCKALAQGLKGNQVITELNIADSNLATGGTDMSGIITLADVIPDMGALSSANLLGNRIGNDQAKALAAILKEHSTLKSLCGNRGGETKLDMSGKKIGVEGAIMLAPEISDNRAMTSLNLASNRICWMGNMDGIKAISSAIKVLAVILVPFSSLSDFSFNCCCLLLSSGYEGVDQDRPQQEQHPVRSGGEAPAHLRGWWH
jgi:Ran GTPase-activating protein (RanGAP) involved in mRNA processing and transport